MTRLVLAAAAGGAVGAAGRFLLGEAAPDPDSFPWTTLAINVVGSVLLALLPSLGRVRRSPVLTVGLGPGLLGGFTTLSTYSEQTRDLLADGRVAIALTYLLVTLGACVVGVLVADRLSSPAEQDVVAAEGGDE